MGSLPSGRARGILLITAVALVGAVIAVLALGAVRQSVILSLQSGILRPSFLLALIPFAAWSFGLRVLRWHVLVRRLAPATPLRVSGFSQMVGFAFSATPGRIAELYKLRLLDRAVGLPVAQSLPAALVERLTDVIAFGLLIVIGGVVSLGTGGLPGLAAGGTALLARVTHGGAVPTTTWVLVALGIVALVAAVRAWRRRAAWWKRLRAGLDAQSESDAGWLRLIPGRQRILATASQLRSGGARVADPPTLALALACVTVGRLGDSLVLWQIAHAVGYPMPFALALVMIGSAGFVGGITLSPGGLGAAEAALVGLVVAHGAPIGAALVIAFGTRVVIFWLWVLVGLVLFATSHGKQIASWAGFRVRHRSVLVEE